MFNDFSSKNNTIFAGLMAFAVIATVGVIMAKVFSFPLITSLITGGAFSLFAIVIYRWKVKTEADVVLQNIQDETQPVFTPANIASKLNVKKNDLNKEQKPFVQERVNDNKIKTKRLFALDFDETITINHTFPETQLAVVRVFANTKQRDYAFKQSKTDQQVMANLRNLEQTKNYIQDILVDDCLIIVTRHNNIEWVKRNLHLLLCNEDLVDKIEVYALQHPSYIKYADKLDAIHGHIEKLQSDLKEPVEINAAYLIDNDIRECRALKLKLQQQKHTHPDKFANIMTIHADERDHTNVYLEVVCQAIGRAESPRKVL